MGHLSNISKYYLPTDIPAGRKGDTGSACLEFSALQKVSQHDGRIFFIRHFNANGRFPRDRRFDSYIRHCQVQLNIIRQTDDLANLHSLLRLEFISGHARAAAHIRNLNLYPKAFQSGFQFCRCLTELFIRITAIISFPPYQKG